MIQVFKFNKGFDITAPNTLTPNMSTTGLRGHEFKLYKSAFSTNIGKFSFSNRIIDDWNSLPQHVVPSNIVNTFKIRLDRHYCTVRGLDKSQRHSSPCRPVSLLIGFTLNYVILITFN